MSFPLAKAVRMSLSIPIYFTPIPVNSPNGENLIVDGGLLSNFPVWLFDVKGAPRWPTFGLNLLNNRTPITPTSESSLVTYLLDIVETFFSHNNITGLPDHHVTRIINIPTLGIKAIDFNITREEIETLFQSGYRAAEAFLQTWDFQQYIELYR